MDDLGLWIIVLTTRTLQTPNSICSQWHALYTNAYASSSTCTQQNMRSSTGTISMGNENARSCLATAPLLSNTAQWQFLNAKATKGFNWGSRKWISGLGTWRCRLDQEISPGPNHVGFGLFLYHGRYTDPIPTVYRRWKMWWFGP